MDIFVIGKGEHSVAPDKVFISATIFAKSSCAMPAAKRHGVDLSEEEQRCKEEVTELGISKAEMFMSNIIDKMSIDRTDVTTDRFNISTNTINISANYREPDYVFDNCTYTQFFRFSFDYDKQRLAKLMELFTQNASFASCDIDFGLKKETNKKFIDTVIQNAYKDAHAQALSIARSAGFEQVVCVAASHESFTSGHLTSTSNYRSNDMAMMQCKKMSESTRSIAERFVDIFNPDDITISKTIYYHFKSKTVY